ncbi:MAG: hypothetical protein QM749_16180 [Aquabacterium sp.]
MMGPDCPLAGTAVESDEELAALVAARAGPKEILSPNALGWKLVPEIVTEVPAVPIFGVKSVMTGAKLDPTVNDLELVTVPLLLVTLMVPVDTPAGAVTFNVLALADVTVAATPLNLTVLFAATGSKPVPKMDTLVPALPLAGEKSARLRALAATCLMDVILPAASYAYCALLPSEPTVSTKRPSWS